MVHDADRMLGLLKVTSLQEKVENLSFGRTCIFIDMTTYGVHCSRLELTSNLRHTET